MCSPISAFVRSLFKSSQKGCFFSFVLFLFFNGGVAATRMPMTFTRSGRGADLKRTQLIKSVTFNQCEEDAHWRLNLSVFEKLNRKSSSELQRLRLRAYRTVTSSPVGICLLRLKRWSSCCCLVALYCSPPQGEEQRFRLINTQKSEVSQLHKC